MLIDEVDRLLDTWGSQPIFEKVAFAVVVPMVVVVVVVVVVVECMLHFRDYFVECLDHAPCILD